MSELISIDKQPCMQGYSLSEMSLVDKAPMTFLTLLLQTGYLKPREDKLLSALFIGGTGTGKTRILSTTQKLKRVNYTNDITPKYLVEFLEQARKGQKDFIVIPDFIQCSEGHGRQTRTTLLGIMRGMIEEGITNLQDYKMEFASDFPVKVGLITAITIDSLNVFRLKWKKQGFLSRLLPFSFQHSAQTRQTIMHNINNQIKDRIRKFKFQNINRKPKHVELTPELVKQLEPYSLLLSKQTCSEPYRHQKQLIALAEATAVLDNSPILKKDHIDLVTWLCTWLNYDFNAT